jgi:hypothetical protein
MDSGFLAEPVIGLPDFARARWLGPGMTEFMRHISVDICNRFGYITANQISPKRTPPGDAGW